MTNKNTRLTKMFTCCSEIERWSEKVITRSNSYCFIFLLPYSEWFAIWAWWGFAVSLSRRLKLLGFFMNSSRPFIYDSSPFSVVFLQSSGACSYGGRSGNFVLIPSWWTLPQFLSISKTSPSVRKIFTTVTYLAEKFVLELTDFGYLYCNSFGVDWGWSFRASL